MKFIDVFQVDDGEELFVLDVKDKSCKPMAFFEYLAKASIAGFLHPLRLEAKEYNLDKSEKGQILSFEAEVQQAPLLSRYPSNNAVFLGNVKFTLPNDELLIYYKMFLQSECLVYLYYIRSSWLRVGTSSFGMKRYDAILPGIEWVIGEEWSSGTDYFKHPQALRISPHPYKIAISIIPISFGGIGLLLILKPYIKFSRAFRYPKPVFAIPNFVSLKSHHLLGLIILVFVQKMTKKNLRAVKPLQIHRDASFSLDAQIYVVRGTWLDVVINWVKCNGMPNPDISRYEWEEILERIAKAYNTNLWAEAQGWSHIGKNLIPYVLEFVSYYIENDLNDEIRVGLKEKAVWCRKIEQNYNISEFKIGLYEHQFFPCPLDWMILLHQDFLEIGNVLFLEIQMDEGDFPFDPHGRHRAILNTDWSKYWRPLGQIGKFVVDLCATVVALILANRNNGKKRFIKATCKILEFVMHFGQPEGSDCWETPLYSPDLLAAGDAAIAYYLGYKELSKRDITRKLFTGSGASFLLPTYGSQKLRG